MATSARNVDTAPIQSLYLTATQAIPPADAALSIVASESQSHRRL